MRNIFKLPLLLLTMIVLFSTSALAKSAYPETLENGNLVLVNAHMGRGHYADRASVVVQQYAPPEYQIEINIILVEFSEEYYRQYKTFVGSPYTISHTSLTQFRYNYNQKVVYWYSETRKSWMKWDINRENTFSDGNPLIPNAAETAFVTAYNMRFYDDTEGCFTSKLGKMHRVRVINEEFYERLGIGKKKPSKPQAQHYTPGNSENASNDDELITFEDNNNQNARIQELNNFNDIVLKAIRAERKANEPLDQYVKEHPGTMSIADRSTLSKNYIAAIEKVKASIEPQPLLDNLNHLSFDEKETCGDLLQIMNTRYDKIIESYSFFALNRELTPEEQEKIKTLLAEVQSLGESVIDMSGRVDKLSQQ